MTESDEKRAERLMLSRVLSDASAKLKFIPLTSLSALPSISGDDNDEDNDRKLLLARLERLWSILKPPDAVKLEFKFIIKVIQFHCTCMYANVCMYACKLCLISARVLSVSTNKILS